MRHNADLHPLRQEIDHIDAAIIELLARRFRVTAEVGRIKAEAALAPVDPAREAAQTERFQALARQHGLAPDLVVDLFRRIIDEVVKNHRDIRANAAAPPAP